MGPSHVDIKLTEAQTFYLEDALSSLLDNTSWFEDHHARAALGRVRMKLRAARHDAYKDLSRRRTRRAERLQKRLEASVASHEDAVRGLLEMLGEEGDG